MTAKILKAAVLGHPVAHSLSPAIHNYWIGRYGLQGQYEAIDVAPERLAVAISGLIDEGYNGFNITIPHKQAALALCHEVDEGARQVGAVNTISIDEKGKICGTNTDIFGFVLNMKEQMPGFDFKAGPALVLGAGGAARAIVCALKKQEAPQIIVANRTLERAQALAHDFGVKAIEWEGAEKAMAECALLVNTTALGMKGHPPLNLDLKQLSPKAAVGDIVYNPESTPLLQAAAVRGNVTVGGLGMLLHQARLAFSHWTGILPDITAELQSLIAQQAGGPGK